MWENTLNLNLLAATNLKKVGTGAIKGWRNKKTAITFYHSYIPNRFVLNKFLSTKKGRKSIVDTHDFRWNLHDSVMEVTEWAEEHIQKSLSIKTVHHDI